MKIYSKDYFALPTINKHLLIITYWLSGRLVTSAKVESKCPLSEYWNHVIVTRGERVSQKVALKQHNAAIANIENIKALALDYYSLSK